MANDDTLYGLRSVAAERFREGAISTNNTVTSNKKTHYPAEIKTCSFSALCRAFHSRPVRLFF